MIQNPVITIYSHLRARGFTAPQGLTRDIVVYGSILVICKLIQFATIPIIIRLVPAADYGIYMLFLTLEGLMLPVTTLNLHGALHPIFYDKTVVAEDGVSTIALSILGFNVLLLAFACIVPGGWLAMIGSSDRLCFVLIILSTGINAVITLFSQLLRLKNRSMLYGGLMLLQSFMIPLACIWSSVWFPTATLLLYARLLGISVVLVGGLLTIHAVGFRLKRFNIAVLKQSMSIAVPTIVYSACAYLFLSFDRIALNKVLGADVLGTYCAIFQIVGMISSAGVVLTTVWLPWLFANMADNTPSSKAAVVKATYAIALLSIAVALAYAAVLGYLLPLLLPQSAIPLAWIRWPFAIGFACEMVYLLVSPYILYEKKTHYNAIIGICMACAGVVLTGTAVSRFGVSGAAIAFMMTWIALASIFCVIGHQVHPMPWYQVLRGSIRHLPGLQPKA